jgi:hypothetical protein
MLQLGSFLYYEKKLISAILKKKINNQTNKISFDTHGERDDGRSCTNNCVCLSFILNLIVFFQ